MKRRTVLGGGAALALTSVAGRAHAADPIKIGVDAVLTGAGADIGAIIQQSAQWAVDQINEKGGVQLPDGTKRPLALVAVDDQSKPDIGLNALKRLVGDPAVVAIMGPDWSSVTFPTLFVGEDAGIAQITSSVAERITHSGQKHIFRARSTDGDWMAAMVDYMVDQGQKDIVVTYGNNEFGRSGHDAFVKALKARHNLDPKLVLSYANGDSDYTPIAGRIVQSGAQAVANLGNEPEGALLIKALKELGYKGMFAFNSADDIFANLAKTNAVGTVGPLSWVETKPDAKSRAFVAAYKAKFHSSPIGHSVIYFDAVNLIAYAISKAGADRGAILKFLKTVDNWDGVQGTYHPSAPTGDMIHSSVIIKYDDQVIPQVVAVKD